MRDIIRMFIKDLDIIRLVGENSGVCISDVARMLGIPYSTAYVRVHRLEKAGLLSFEYASGKKAINLTDIAADLIKALETIEKEEKS